ncbi:MAG: histidine kinase [Sphingomonas sp.]|nr:histidine kinase [Sphingomonas sp.]
MPQLVMDQIEEPPARRGTAWFAIRLKPRIRAILLLTVLFWLSNFAILTGGAVASGAEWLLAIAALRAILALFGVILCFAIHFTLERFAAPTFRGQALLAILLAPVAAEIYAWIVYFGFWMVGPPGWSPTINWASAITSLSYYMWFFLAWTGLYLALNYSFDIQAEKLRSAELRTHAQTAQLRALYNQVNPHFLFNSLNSISALITEGRNTDADRMVGKLATFFRQSLSIDPFEDIPLTRELDLQRAYLEIEQLRYPDLKLDIDFPPELANVAVPALILQPLVENAVKYGVAGSAPPARIAISARAREDLLSIAVTDGGTTPPTPEGNAAGLGLNNVRQRLEQRFGRNHALDTRWNDPGFTCTITLPLIMASA